MGVHLRSKLEVSSIILTGFRQGVFLRPPLSPQSVPLKGPPRLGLKCSPKILRMKNNGINEGSYQNVILATSIEN